MGSHQVILLDGPFDGMMTSTDGEEELRLPVDDNQIAIYILDADEELGPFTYSGAYRFSRYWTRETP
jgi:hypothetical protein